MTDVADRLVLPSHDDPVVAAASTSIGGPMGRRALVGRSWWSPIRVMLVLVILSSALGLALDQPCLGTAWGDGTTQYSRSCYSDIVHLYWGRGIGDGIVPYVGHPSQAGDEQVEYPVLTGLTMYVLGRVVPRDWNYTNEGQFYFVLNAIVIALLAAVTVWATSKTVRRRPWDAAMIAVAPGLILASTINWDLYAVALVALGLLAWSRRYPVLTGLLLGLGADYKFYPLLLLGPLLVLCVRAGRLKEFGLALAGCVAAWVVVNVPFMVANFDGWARFYNLSRDRGADYGSVWLVLNGLGANLTPQRLNVWGTALFAACCLAIALLGLMAPRRPRLAQMCFLTLAAFLLTNKVYSPQFVLWLIPLAVLARPRWRDFLWWQAAEVVYFLSVWWYILGMNEPNSALPARGYWLAIGVHIAATLVYCGFVVRDILQPDCDPVRAGTGDDDPGGGVLDEAPDRFALTTTSRGVVAASR